MPDAQYTYEFLFVERSINGIWGCFVREDPHRAEGPGRNTPISRIKLSTNLF